MSPSVKRRRDEGLERKMETIVMYKRLNLTNHTEFFSSTPKSTEVLSFERT